MVAEQLSELSFHRLPVAVDGSEHADLALAAAITAAGRDHAAITLPRRGPSSWRRPQRATTTRSCWARGLGRVGALLGSVSDHVLHHATIAVFVARAPRG